MAVLQILRANIRSKKGNFISIFVLLFIIVVALSAIISIQNDYKEKIQESCEYSSVADITTFIAGKNVTNEMIQTVEQMKQVKSVLVRDGISLDTKNMTISGTTYDSSVILCKYNAASHRYRMYDISGEDYAGGTFQAPEKGGIYLPVTMKNKIPCKVGDEIVIQKNGWKKEFKIEGFYEEPMVGASMIGVKLFILNDADYQELLDNKAESGCTYYPLVEIYLKDQYKEKANVVKKEINEKSGLVDAGFYTMIQNQSVEYTNLFVYIVNTVLAAFALLLLLIVLIIIGHNVNATIEMEYRQLGILKSLGFTSWNIRSSILLEYLFAGLAASVFGTAGSILLIHVLNRIYIPITGLLIHAGIRLAATAVCLLIVLLVIALYIVLRTRKITAISPVQAMSNGMEAVYFAGRVDFDITQTTYGGLSWRLIWKQLRGNWKKYVTNLLIMALLVSFTMTVSSIQQISNEENAVKIFGGYISDISIDYDKDTEKYVEEIQKQIEQSLQIKKKYVLFSDYVSVDGNEILAKVIDKTENMQTVMTGRAPRYENEIATTEMTADMLGKKIGDRVTIKFNDITASYMIVGTYQDTSDAGISINLLASGFQKLAPDYHIYSISYQVKNRDDITETVKQLNKQYKNLGESLVINDDAKKNRESDHVLIMAINSMTWMTYVLAMIFAAVISLMICRKNFMQEKRDMGICKSLGFTTTRLRMQFTVKYMIVVILGAVSGIILNVCLNNSLVEALFFRIGVSRFDTDYNPQLILCPAIFLIGATAFFAWMASGRIKKVSPKNLIHE